MPTVPHIIRMRERRRERANRNPLGRAFLGCTTSMSFLAALAAVVFALVYTNLTNNLPSLETLPLLLEPPDGFLLQPTRIYDRTGEQILLELENPAAAERRYLTLDVSQPNHLPPTLITTTLATVDPTFWHNPGFSLQGLNSGSHSTLAQNLVSDLLLWNEPIGLRRALRERLLAAQIIARFGREQVLTWYLNSTNYGRLAYGADAAARVYFGKPAKDLNLAESALLAAVAEAPALNPIDAPQVALERQQVIVQLLLAQGFITAEQAEEAGLSKIKLREPVAPAANPAPAFVNIVLDQLDSMIDLRWLERGGFRVVTTLDYNLQLQVACAAATQLARLENLPDVTTTSDGTPCEAARLLPTLPPRVGNLPLGPRASAVVLDPQTGQVLAMAGVAPAAAGPPAEPFHFTSHPPGSLLTAFIYLTGFTRGLSPSSLVWDIPTSQAEIEVQNFDGLFHGPLRLRTAMANDYIVVAAQVLEQIGVENAWRTARQLGLDSLDPPIENSLNAFMDSGEITLLDASQAFGVFSNQGTLVGWGLNPTPNADGSQSLDPLTILRLEDTTGKLWLGENLSLARPVISSQLAYLVTNVLSDEAARWPSLGHPNSLEIGRPAAAKLGYARGSDAWTIGYTPQLVVGVWVDTEDVTAQFPTKVAAGLWHAVIQFASRDLPTEGWAAPPGVANIDVCDPSGMLPTADCPSVVTEVFLEGSGPTQIDSLYRRLQTNRETGRLATVFTPPELVEERVYLMVPPLAAEWARLAGLPTPPEFYDVILSPSIHSSEVQITSPEMFSHVSEQVTIIGSASGNGFEFYRLQVGKGLNPKEWLRVSQISQAVVEGELGVWDTRGLSGLYAIQLLVVGQDQRIETSIIQVTVDNQPPKALILYPAKGEEISSSQKSTITLQANASDDLALKSVEFYIDETLVDTVTQAPFAVPWRVRLGAHNLVVVVTDLAGNENEASTEFVVKP